MPECQDTGYRLIKRCVKRDQDSGSIIEDKYANEGCELFQGTKDEFTNDRLASTGQFAEPGSEPLSVTRFMLIMAIFGIGITIMLNKRKDRILNEIYSKISIVNRN